MRRFKDLLLHVQWPFHFELCTVLYLFYLFSFMIFLSDLPLYWDGKTQTQRKDTLIVNNCLKSAKETENLQATHIAAKYGPNFLSYFLPGTDTQ